MDRFFQVDNRFHDMISLMGKNLLADRISRVVCALTYAMRYETVSTMIRCGHGADLVAAHRKLYETLESGVIGDVEEIVWESYFGETLCGEGAPSEYSSRFGKEEMTHGNH